MSETAPEKRFSLRRISRKVWATVAAIAIALTGTVVATNVAEAMDRGVGYGVWATTGGDHFRGAFRAPNGELVYCVQPGVPLPSGNSVSNGYTGISGLSANRVAGINRIITEYGQTNDANTAVAVSYAVKAAVNYQATVDEDTFAASGYPGYGNVFDGVVAGNNIEGQINWSMNQFVGRSGVEDIIRKFRSYYNVAVNTTAGASGSGWANFTFQVDPFQYNGTLTVSTSHAGLGGTVTLTNGVFTDTGSSTRSNVRSGDVLPIRGVAPTGAASYKISASGTWTVSGGYAGNIHMWKTSGQQDSVGRGQPASWSFTGNATDPTNMVVQFAPAVRTAAPDYVQQGQSLTDNVTFFTTTVNGSNNPWPTTADGSYRSVSAKGTLYGPFSNRPAESATPPANAPVVTTTFLNTPATTEGGPRTYTANIGTARESGFYTWVWEINYDSQPAATRIYMPAGYSFADRFGLTAETSIVPMKPTAVTQASQEWANVGDRISDTVTVSNNGAWLQGTPAVFHGKAYGLPTGTDPSTIWAVPSNARVLFETSLTFTSPGSKRSDSFTVPAGYGAVVWVWSFDAASQAAPNLFNAGYTWQDMFGLKNETTRIRMAPKLTTQVNAAQPTAAFNDTVTITTDSGVWIAGTTVKATGKLYGPLNERPSARATVPANTPVAYETELSFTGLGSKSTNSGFRPTAAGWYTWVWSIDAAEQTATTQTVLPNGYKFTDQFGLANETSFRGMTVTGSSTVVQTIADAGAQVSDRLAVASTNGAWLKGTTARFEGTAYAVRSGNTPNVTNGVPSNAYAIGTQTLSFDTPGMKTSAPVTVPNDAGFVVWVWKFVAADQAVPSLFANGYTWTDRFGLPEETTKIRMQPVVTTQVVAYEPSGAFNDRVTLSMAKGQWVPGSTVKATGKLYGPLNTRPTATNTAPSGAPLAHQAEVTFTGVGTKTTSTGFNPTDAGWYTWVWTIDSAAQDATTRANMPSGYKFTDRYGLADETSFRGMKVVGKTQVVDVTADAGQRVADQVTVSTTNGEWLKGAAARFEGIAYAVPSGTRPAVTNDVPAGAYVIGKQTLTFTAPGTKTSAPVTVPDDAGFVVWVWTFVAADQADPQHFPTGYTWKDKFAIVAETNFITMQPVLSTDVVAYEPDAAFNDKVTLRLAKGQWVPGTKVKATGKLYGPLLKRPTASNQAPAGTPVAFETSVTFDKPGTITTDSKFSPAEAGWYTWVWTIDAAEQNNVTKAALPKDYKFSDRFGLAAETSFRGMQVVGKTNVAHPVANAGQLVTDQVTVSMRNGTWLTGAVATFEGTAYAVPSGVRPLPGVDVPPGAYEIGKQTLSFTGPGTKTSRPVVVPANAGFVVWVWTFKTANQADPQFFKTGYSWNDLFADPDETSFITMQPALTTEVVEYEPDTVFNDSVTLSLLTGQWVPDAKVKATGKLYGPLLERPTPSVTVPDDAKLAYETSLTFESLGTLTTDTGFSPTEAGWYTWVWTIDAAEQDDHTRAALPKNYRFADQFGLATETSFRGMRITGETAVVNSTADTGDEIADRVTVTMENGTWLTGAVARFDGTAYAIPSGVRPEVGDTVPEGAYVIGTQSLSFSEPGTKTSAPVTVPDDAGFVVWVWNFVAADQADTQHFRTGLTWQDRFAVPAETNLITMQPQVTTEAVEYEPGADFNDRVSVHLATGQWAPGVQVKAEGKLYGPLLERPAEPTAVAPEGTNVAFETSLTFDGPGTITTDTGFRPTDAGWYTWVWTIDAASQDAETKAVLPKDYVYTDQFGLEAETSFRGMEVIATSTVVEHSAEPFQQVSDRLAVSNANGEWLTGAVARFEGTAYAIPSGVRPAVGDDIPENAYVIGTQSLTFDGPGVKTSTPVTVPEDAGFVVWVWSFVAAEQDDPHFFRTGYTWKDKFGLADETTTVQFSPALASAVLSRIPGEAFEDTLEVWTARGQWHEGVEVVAHGTLYGPYLTEPEQGASVPEGAPVAKRAVLRYTEPGLQVTDTGFRPEETGYYNWVWVIRAEDQSPETRAVLPAGFYTADDFGLVEETSILPMELDVTTKVAKPGITLGEDSVDTLTVDVANGDWIQKDGKNIPVTLEGTAYFVPGADAPEQSSDVPEGAEKLDTVLLTVTEAGEYTAPASRGEESRQGHVTWVWTVRTDLQPEELRGMVVEWTDAFGIEDETHPVLVPGVTTKAIPGVKKGEEVQDTAFVTGTIPLRGAELTFEAYRVPMKADGDRYVPDAPEGTEPGDWTWVENEANLVYSNLDGGEIITETGEHLSPKFVAEEHMKVLWVESLWSVPAEVTCEEPAEPGEGEETESGEEGEETPEAPACEQPQRELIARGVIGEPNETTFVLDVKTVAETETGARTDVEHGVKAWDTAEMVGYIPEGGTVEFEAYIVPDSFEGELADACVADSLAWTSPKVRLVGGLYTAENPLRVTGEAHLFDPDVNSQLYWVEVTRDAEGREVSRGVCGDEDETLGLRGQRLIRTGGELPLTLALGGLVLLTGAGVFLTVRRRRNAD